MKKTTILDIARMANISPSSVSRVINDITGVKPETRRLVMEIINQTGYQLNPPANGLGKRKINVVGLIIGDVRNPFYADIMYYIQKILQHSGYHTIFFNSEYNNKKEIECLTVVKQIGFSGVIMITALQSTELSEVIDKFPCPVVLLNRLIENYNGSVVVLDNFQAGYMVTKHLIELGHPNIAFLAGPMNSTSSSQRVKGYLQALVNYSIPFKDDYIIQGDLTMDTGYQIARNIIPRINTFPSAIICGNDLMAIGFLNCCKEHNIHIPEDFSIAGFDDIFISRFQGIELTTIRQPTMKMAKKATELLLSKMKDPASPNQRIILEPELIIRRTTAMYHKPG